LKGLFRTAFQLIEPRDRRRWYLVLGLSLVVSVVEGVGVVLILVLFKAIEVGGSPHLPLIGSVDQWTPGWTPRARISLVAGAIAVFFVIRAALVLLQLHLQYETAGKSGLALSRRLVHRYLCLPLDQHFLDNSSRFIRNINESTEVVAQQMFLPILAGISESVLVVAVVGVLLAVAPLETILGAVLLSISVGLALRFVNPRTQRYGSTTQESYRRSLTTLTEMFSGIRDVKVSGREDFFASQYMAERSEFIRARYMPLVLANVPRLATETTFVTLLVLLLIVLTPATSGSTTVLPVLAIFAYGVLRLLPSVNRISQSVANIRFGIASMENIEKDAVVLSTQSSMEHPFERLRLRDSIRVEAVSYRYPTSRQDAVCDLDLVIPKGTSIGIVGPTGGGKSTLIDLILGLLTPSQGRVSVDDVDIARDVRAWQSAVGLVPQVVFLLDDTIRRNVAFGIDNDEIDDDRVMEALRIAQLEGFVHSLPDGIRTTVGERGTRISGGQRQRIAIARSLYSRPDVLVFDEGTSALDSDTERLLTLALASLQGRHTLILVAHRLSTVRDCNQIVVLTGGVIRATGTYNELLEHSEEFRLLAR
jgi:ATP-binding cassette subfamily C protein